LIPKILPSFDASWMVSKMPINSRAAPSDIYKSQAFDAPSDIDRSQANDALSRAAITLEKLARDFMRK
jgi:hypothetical protein